MRVDLCPSCYQGFCSMAKAATPTSFKPGVSGNPSGRPKVCAEFKDKARKIADERVIQFWEREIANEGPNAMKASELLAAYAYGKPTQAVDVSGEMTNTLAVDGSVTALIANLRKNRGK
jgi:hypothetical protein